MNRYEQILKDYLMDNETKKYKEMKKSGELREYLKIKAEAAQNQKADLVNEGLLDNQAEEIAIRDLLAV